MLGGALVHSWRGARVSIAPRGWRRPKAREGPLPSAQPSEGGLHARRESLSAPVRRPVRTTAPGPPGRAPWS
ncbi:hypothetical protein DMH01_01600 [Amycolatopsis sp. WAC 04182]|nr:hypothetical protein DMH01_01600 [Amycolatopsis sp. WAC 04182]